MVARCRRLEAGGSKAATCWFNSDLHGRGELPIDWQLPGSAAACRSSPFLAQEEPKEHPAPKHRPGRDSRCRPSRSGPRPVAGAEGYPNPQKIDPRTGFSPHRTPGVTLQNNLFSSTIVQFYLATITSPGTTLGPAFETWVPRNHTPLRRRLVHGPSASGSPPVFVAPDAATSCACCRH